MISFIGIFGMNKKPTESQWDAICRDFVRDMRRKNREIRQKTKRLEKANREVNKACQMISKKDKAS